MTELEIKLIERIPEMLHALFQLESELEGKKAAQVNILIRAMLKVGGQLEEKKELEEKKASRMKEVGMERQQREEE